MKHTHAALIKAWADGAEIEFKSSANEWVDAPAPTWCTYTTYRIKPEPKPDVIDYALVTKHAINNFMPNIEWVIKSGANLKFIWDGETGKLKSAEVIQ
jgi:hypothetical protein